MATSTPEQVRAFIAVALEPGWIVELEQLQRKLQTNLVDEVVRWVRPEQLHLTLRFLGNVARECLAGLTTALDCACAGIAPFELSLESVGCFPQAKNPRVVWVGIQGDLDSLRRLHDQVERETQGFGDHREKRAFQPHLTIGRVQGRGRTARHLGELVDRVAVSNPGELTVRQVHLMQSDLSSSGACYRTLATATLVQTNADTSRG